MAIKDITHEDIRLINDCIKPFVDRSACLVIYPVALLHGKCKAFRLPIYSYGDAKRMYDSCKPSRVEEAYISTYVEEDGSDNIIHFFKEAVRG